MFTPDQETYLIALADAGLAEQAEITDRNQQVLVDAEVHAAREAKLADLKAEAQAVIDKGLEDFDNNVASTIAAGVVSKIASE